MALLWVLLKKANGRRGRWNMKLNCLFSLSFSSCSFVKIKPLKAIKGAFFRECPKTTAKFLFKFLFQKWWQFLLVVENLFCLLFYIHYIIHYCILYIIVCTYLYIMYDVHLWEIRSIFARLTPLYRINWVSEISTALWSSAALFATALPYRFCHTISPITLITQ